MVRLLDGQIRLFRRHFSPAGFKLVYHVMKVGILVRIAASELSRRLRRSDSDNLWAGIWRRRAEWTRGARTSTVLPIDTGSTG
jgi:hypothetical protein